MGQNDWEFLQEAIAQTIGTETLNDIAETAAGGSAAGGAAEDIGE